MKKAFLFIYVWLMVSQVHCELVEIIDLRQNWSLENQNNSIILEDLTVPSGVYSAYTERYKENVLNSYNDVNMRWIAKDTWMYSIEFSLSAKLLDSSRYCNLTFYGIDTVASIYLNGKFLGDVDNMFVRYSFDVTGIISSDNELQLKFTSPIHEAKRRADTMKQQNITIPPECSIDRYNGECHMNFLRKMQASFAWDWGLAAPSMGIWKPVHLEFYEAAILRDVDVGISKNKTHWNMDFRVYMDAGGIDFFAELTVYLIELMDKALIISEYKQKPMNHLKPMLEFQVAIELSKVEQWWPNGYGSQKLYPMRFTLNSWLNSNARSKRLSKKSINIGFRTIELIENEAPNKDGNTFLFKVNGEEIFMKGSNYIPSHILPELANNEERITHLLKCAKDTHINMIRAWGGGVYESDLFYDLADKYGILVWQDMMFACAMYPTNAEFLASVRKEVEQNAKRIAHHASLAIFATNNENEVALAQNWYDTGSDERYRKDYRELYISNVMHELQAVEHVSRPRPLLSSPSNGKYSEKDYFLSADPQNPNYGDVHFYDVLRDAWDASIYPRPRFASEFGFQSLPKMSSWLRSMNSETDDLLELIRHRQHYPLSMLPITSLIRRHLPLPLPEEDSYAEALIYMSQITQAMATKVETQLYRSLRDTDHRTMGALYWQLNDVWIAPSWSSIDFYGNPKLLHYWAKDFMAPISIIALYDSKSKAINISLTCDSLKAVDSTNMTVNAKMYYWSQLTEVSNNSWPVTLKTNGVQYDKIIALDELFVEPFTMRNSFVEFTLEQNSQILSTTYYFPQITAAEGIGDPQIKLDIAEGANYRNNKKCVQNFSLTTTVRRPAIFLYFDIDHPQISKYMLSKNGFMQLVPVTVTHLKFETPNCSVVLSSSDIKILTINQFM